MGMLKFNIQNVHKWTKNLSLKCKILNSNYIDEKDKGIRKNAMLTDKHIQMAQELLFKRLALKSISAI